MRILVLFLFVLVSVAVVAQSKYPVADIPAELLKDVNAVVREDRVEYEILAQDRAREKVRMVVTILNSNADRYAEKALFYDKMIKVGSINGAVYDASGKVVRKLKNSDIRDQSSYEGINYFSDNRYKFFSLTHTTYPYTVEYEYENEYKYLFHIGGSSLSNFDKSSTQLFVYQITYPEALRPKYRQFNLPAEPTKTKNADGTETIVWRCSNIATAKAEPYIRSEDAGGRVEVAPIKFDYDGYSGTMETWDDFGRWIATLNAGRDVLPEATKRKVVEITSKYQSKEEKVKAVYEYMQGRTRYVSIQLGIGGWQPIDAKTVDESGYGDCKALSNYMISMLKLIDIKSHYVLIQSGYGQDFDPSFVMPQFDHAIVAVPLEKDTLWLECTSQTVPMGYQGFHTGDRRALLITDNGAKVVKTTRYPAQVNLQLRSAKVSIDANGDATAKLTTHYSGTQYETDGLYSVLHGGTDEQKKWLEKNIQIPSFEVLSFEFKNQKLRIPKASVSAELNLRRFASLSGKRLFLTPNLMNRVNSVPERSDARINDVTVYSNYTDVDSILYQLPENLIAEALPPPTKVASRFGEYECSYMMNEKGLLYTRRLVMRRGRYPKETYSELVDFYKNVKRADNTKISLINRT